MGSVVKMDERFNISKHEEDVGNVKVMLYNFEFDKNFHQAKMYITDLNGSIVKTYDAIWTDKDALFFKFDNSLKRGEYFFNIALITEYESVDIIYDRRLKIC